MSIYFDLVFNIPFEQSFTYIIDEKSNAAVGKRAMVNFRGRDCLGFIIAERESPAEGVKSGTIKKIRRVVDNDILFGADDIELAKWIAEYYLCSTGQALSAMLPSGKRAPCTTLSGLDFEAEPQLKISYEQNNALKAITAPLTSSSQSGFCNMFYLYGVTGSGKTEVFLRAARQMLDEGKSVIYLVPEITLTHQTAEVIKKRFGSQSATLHSGMSPSLRFAEWMRIRSGEAFIVVGPRSAVFAPVKNLGLIIIDEEHDGSYKSGNTPRYHARQIALRRCTVSSADSAKCARLVMGSATPSAEAWKLMSEGKIKRLDLTQRVSGGAIEKITPVSLAKTSGCLTKELTDEIRNTHNMGRQTILFLNRRGFAYFYKCHNCGWEQLCRRCSVSLTWHKSKGGCICHYCGYSEAPPASCPSCGSVETGWRGFGTEMIEEEVRRNFPGLRIRRIDADTAGKKSGSGMNNLEDTLARFKAGLIDILLGTQMVAKGLNFPGVRLVGIVFADTGLHLPDFRAAERTFSLIVQVAGRAGRFFPDGKVILQTMRMDDPAIKCSCNLDVGGFFEAELTQRKALNFPPYSRLIRFTIRSKEEMRCNAAIKRLASLAKALLPQDADMLGPAECPIGMINNNYRRHLILRSRKMSSIHFAARELIARYEKGKDTRTYLEVDVDPVSML